MQPVQFEPAISLHLNDKVRVVLIPAGERLYEDWQDEEYNKLSLTLNDEGK